MIEKQLSQLNEIPLIAILRGIKPSEAIAVSDQLVEAGFTCMEITLNSENWEESLRLINKRHGDTIVLGAGTVLKPNDVNKVKDMGGKIIISPNCDTEVIKRTKELGMISAPGCYTPSECFKALDAGADIIKIFPADTLGLPFIKAISAVLPSGTRLCPTGGVNPANMNEFLKTGVFTMGIGSALYKAGKSMKDIRLSADEFVMTYKKSSN